MVIYLKTDDEIVLMRQANRLVANTLAELSKYIVPGVSTLKLNKIADEFIRDHHAIPTFKHFPNPLGGRSFPASICTSVNSCVVHGVPTAASVLKEGDIISIDCGVKVFENPKQPVWGYCGDSAYTFCVGEVADDVRNLLKVTEEALYKAIDVATAGARVGDISHCVQKYCESRGYGVVRELTGHGIGREMHEDPSVPNYGRRHGGALLQEGMCIAIEPMATLGSPEIILSSADRWSVYTKDHQPAAHFEHTILVTQGKAEILSLRNKK